MCFSLNTFSTLGVCIGSGPSSKVMAMIFSSVFLYREPFNQAVTDYRFKIPETGYETTIASAALDSKLELNGGIEKDSFCVSLSNPLQLELSWYVYQGNRLLQKGSGCNLHRLDCIQR